MKQPKLNSIEVVPVNEFEYYPLTHPQMSIWYTEKMFPSTSISNVAGTARIKGIFDFDLLEKAINLVIEKNDSFRIRITNKNGEEKQYINAYKYRKIDFIDFSIYDDPDIQMYKWDEEQTSKPFNLYDSDLFYFAMIKINDEESAYYAKIHHIISDAWTMSLLVNETFTFYSSLKRGEDIPEEKYPSYIEYVNSEIEYKNSDRFIKDQQYWLNRFDPLPEATVLKTQITKEKHTKSKRKTIITPAKFTNKLRDYCKENNTTLYPLFLAALAMYINRVTEKEDIVIGTLILNRSNRKEKNTTGMFINTLPLRLIIDSDTNFKTFSKYVSAESMSLLRHQKYPYDLLLKNIRSKYNYSENLYDIALSYQNSKMEKDATDDQYSTRWHFNHHQVNSLTIHINDRDDDGRLIIDYDYHEDLYSGKEIDFLHTHMLSLLWHALDNHEKNINKIEMLPESEKSKILYEFNNNKTDYPKDKTIQQLFEEQVERTPDSVALIFEDKTMTYRELNQKANQLAYILRSKGVQPDDIIALMMERSFDVLIGILGILKAGCAFLPIDPEYPDNRIRLMIEDSNAKIILTQAHIANKIGTAIDILVLDKMKINSEWDQNPNNINKPTDLAYVIYTSGSTGRPKGAMIEHRNMVNFIYGVKAIMDYTVGISVLSMTTISFDIFLFETLPSLINGLRIIIANKEQQISPKMLHRLIIKHNIKKVLGTPSRIQALVEDSLCYISFKNITEFMVGGDVFPPQLLEKIKNITNAKIFNGYGPTETAIGVTFKELTESNNINIGKPINNVNVYILDKHMNPVPLGIPGNFYIGGDAVGRGYINKPQETNLKFISNPFIPGEKIYNSGDMAKWYPKGEIDFWGRIDHQIKLRGFRIELGEIEARMLTYPTIVKAVVIDKENKDRQKYLCAYYISNNDIIIEDLKKFLAKDLPYYMIPSYYMRICDLPLTPNGKIDRNALPEIKIDMVITTRYRKPETKTEKVLSKIWEDVLSIKRVSKDSNFFELGGDSLNAITLLNHIHRVFNIELSFDVITKMPTLAEMSAYIDSTKRNEFIPIPAAEKREFYPLLPSQKRIYILSAIENGSLNYNMPFALKLEGQVDEAKISMVFDELIKRHEALRTSFSLSKGEPVQIIHDSVNFSVSIEDCKEEDINSFIKKNIKPFKLDNAPLLRVSIARLSNIKRIMFVDIHHIISDGMSIKTLLNEFTSLYDGNTLPVSTVSYKDYAMWKSGIELKSQKEYWLGVYNGEIPLIDLHYDFERPITQSFSGKRIHFAIDKNLSRKIIKAARNNGSTIFNLMLAAYNILLSKYSGQEDIIVGTPVSGRRHPDVEKMIGMFVNTLALRNEPSGDKSFIEFLNDVRDSSLKALENQDYPFEELVSNLKLPRSLNRNPLFDTMFIYQKFDRSWVSCKEMDIAPYQFDSDVSKFDLSFEITDLESELSLAIEYCTDLFKTDTIQRMGAHYINILKAVTENIDIRICDIEILTSYEKNMILHNFNNTKIDFEEEKTIHQLFEEQVEKTPDAVAIIFEDNKFTYRQLNEASNRLAWHLKEKGITSNKIVGILVNRSFEMIVGIIAVLKAGGCYLPIDPNYPEERIDYILRDSGANIVLTQKECKGKILSGQEIIDIYDYEITKQRLENPKNVNSGEDLAYVIYTSGSTGNPKGVVLKHSSLMNLEKGISNNISLLPGKIMLSLTSVSFDIFIFETLIPLSSGMTIVITNEEQQRLPELQSELFLKYKIDILQTTPSRMDIILKSKYKELILKNIKDILLGGEVFSAKLYSDLKEYTSANIYNGYGPSETTVYSTMKQIESMYDVNIGKPISNTKIYILDKFLKPVPIGIAGEIYIGGAGVGKGYINQPILTKERFIPDFFSGCGVMYKTGDIAKWLPSGDIEYIGRKDYQVKIRGLRIELGEIENQILLYNGIKKVIVIVKEIDNDKFLCAYFESSDSCTNINISDLRTFLSKKLPYYMIPSFFIMMDELPLTPNGKIDRIILSRMDISLGSNTKHEYPENEIEEILERVWATVLKKDNISVTDNIFEIGGDSLSIIQVQSEIYRYNWGIKTQDFYKYQTIRELSNFIINKTYNREYFSFNENSLNNDFEAAYKKVILHNKKDYKKGILLTGATGFLGIHILYKYLEVKDLDIYCIIRHNSVDQSKKYLIDLIKAYFTYDHTKLNLERIHIIYGDISKDKFGLSKTEYDKLGKNISYVIHTAANVKHLGNYEDFYNTNVKGTEAIINFCLENNLFLYHISTMSISGSHATTNEKNINQFTEKHFFVGQNYYDNVYVRTKFEAEKSIYEAMRKGLAASVLRIGNLTNRYSDGQFQLNAQDNAFYNRIKSIINLKVVPDTILDMKMEFTPVDYCGDAIYKIINSGVQKELVYHLYNHNTISVYEFIQFLDNFGIKVDVVNKNRFDVIIQDMKKGSTGLEIITGLYEYFNNCNNYSVHENIVLSSEKTQNILKKFDFSWPSIDNKYINKIITNMNILKEKELLHE